MKQVENRDEQGPPKIYSSFHEKSIEINVKCKIFILSAEPRVSLRLTLSVFAFCPSRRNDMILFREITKRHVVANYLANPTSRI